MGKGEIARYEQFLLFPQCFQKACVPGASKGVIVWEWVKTCVPLLYACRRQDIIMLSPRGGRAGGVPYSLSGAYLQDYDSYGYETSLVDRSHQGGVLCTGTLTLTYLIFELLPFVYFHT